MEAHHLVQSDNGQVHIHARTGALVNGRHEKLEITNGRRLSSVIVGEQVWGKALLIVALCHATLPAAHLQNTSVVVNSHPRSGLPQASPTLRFVYSFASAKDIEPPLHPILDRTLDILAGPADPSSRAASLQLPSAVVANSHGRVFVADTSARAIHIFDFNRSKYGQLDARGNHLDRPIGLAVDAENKLYVSDELSRTILVYDAGGKFLRRLGQLRGGEEYFQSVGGIAVDRRTGNLYVCDIRRNMVIIMDNRGRHFRTLGQRGGGDRLGEFRSPTDAVVGGGELFILDLGNRRVQIFDVDGKFRSVIRLAYADLGTGLAVDLDSNIYVSNSVTNVIEIYSHQGKLLQRLAPIEDAARFYHPTALWVSPNNCLYVINSGEHRRVTVFQIGTNNAQQCRAGG